VPQRTGSTSAASRIIRRPEIHELQNKFERLSSLIPGQESAGSGAPDDPEQLKAEIEQTREQLGDTAGQLTAKADVKGRTQARAADLTDRAKAKASQTRQQAAVQADSVRSQLAATTAAAGEQASSAGEAVPESVKRAAIGGDAFRSDVLATAGLDDRKSSHGYLSRAEELMADAVGAEQAFFSTCGSSLSVKAPMLAVADGRGDLLISRDAHKSVVAGLVFSGVQPQWIRPR
jgi:hypothetical protein